MYMTDRYMSCHMITAALTVPPCRYRGYISGHVYSYSTNASIEDGPGIFEATSTGRTRAVRGQRSVASSRALGAVLYVCVHMQLLCV